MRLTSIIRSAQVYGVDNFWVHIAHSVFMRSTTPMASRLYGKSRGCIKSLYTTSGIYMLTRLYLTSWGCMSLVYLEHVGITLQALHPVHFYFHA